MTLATQAHLEQFLQVDVTNEPDDAVTMLLENATGVIHAYLDRVIEETTYTLEAYDPPTGSGLWLRQWPVTTVTAVNENGTALTASDYTLNGTTGMLWRTSSSGRKRDWRTSGGPQSITVTYTAGYDMTTDPLIEPEAAICRDVCTRIAGRVFQAAAAYANAPSAASGSIKSISLEGSDSLTYSDAVTAGVAQAAPNLTDDDKAMLERLRRVNI